MSMTLTDHADALFARLEWPDITMEAWRRTNLSQLLPKGCLDDLANQPVPESAAVFPQSADHLALLPHAYAARVITENGIPMAMSQAASRDILSIEWITLSKQPSPLEALGRAEMDASPDRITAWHWQSFPGTLLIKLRGNTGIDKPIIIEERLTQRGNPISSSPPYSAAHLHVQVEGNASLNVIWSIEGAAEGESAPLVNAGFTALIGSNANLDFTLRQNLGARVNTFLHSRINVGRDARLTFRESHLGSRVLKTRARVILNAQGAQAQLKGIYVANENRHFDIATVQEHRSPGTTSDAIYKGAVKSGGRTVFQGLIEVSPHAAKTDAYLSNRNLILGDGARADSLPQLNILTDDVKCSHGSTSGKLDSIQLFYLQSRGYSPEEAARELIRGFIGEALTGASDTVLEILHDDLERALNTA